MEKVVLSWLESGSPCCHRRGSGWEAAIPWRPRKRYYKQSSGIPAHRCPQTFPGHRAGLAVMARQITPNSPPWCPTMPAMWGYRRGAPQATRWIYALGGLLALSSLRRWTSNVCAHRWSTARCLPYWQQAQYSGETKTPLLCKPTWMFFSWADNEVDMRINIPTQVTSKVSRPEWGTSQQLLAKSIPGLCVFAVPDENSTPD